MSPPVPADTSSWVRALSHSSAALSTAQPPNDVQHACDYFLARRGFWQFIQLFGFLFRKAALDILAKPGFYPPSLHVVRLRLSQFGNCKAEGRDHYLDLHAVRALAACARPGENGTADFMLVPHCFGNRVTRLTRICSEGNAGPQPDGCWAWAHRTMQPYFRAWVGEVRRAGPNALMVSSLGSSRLMSKHFSGIPHVISFMGPSDWILNNVLGTDTQELTSSDCGAESRSMSGSGRYVYPSSWPHDVVVQPGSPYQSAWAPPDSRDILFAFVGSRTSCIRRVLLETWNTSGRSDVYVSDRLGFGWTYSGVLQRAKYCLVPDGHMPWSYRFLDVLHHGCVPVVVSASFHPPFHRLLRWGDKDFPAIFVTPPRIPQLYDILAARAEDTHEWRAMQSATFGLSTILEPSSMMNTLCMLAELSLVHQDRLDAKEAEITSALDAVQSKIKEEQIRLSGLQRLEEELRRKLADQRVSAFRPHDEEEGRKSH